MCDKQIINLQGAKGGLIWLQYNISFPKWYFVPSYPLMDPEKNVTLHRLRGEKSAYPISPQNI